MKNLVERAGLLCIISTLVVLMAVAVHVSPFTSGGGGFLLTLLFWISVVEGCVAIAMIGDIVKAKWTGALKGRLLSVYPLIPVLGLLFMVFGLSLSSYPWSHEEGLWLNRWFFLGRNVLVLILAYLAARKYVSLSDAGEEKRQIFGVIYLFLFVLSQSLVAFDWVMSLEYPWVSTLFGGYFFIESVFSGLAVAGVIYFFLYTGKGSDSGSAAPFVLNDLGTLIFGFSLLWAGLFYSQFLVLWYGNLPEEVSFLVKRVSSPPLNILSWGVLAHFFFIPFITLMTKKRKNNPHVVFFVSLTVLTGILLERFVFLAPVIQVEPGSFVINFFAFLLLFTYVISRNSEHDSSE